MLYILAKNDMALLELLLEEAINDQAPVSDLEQVLPLERDALAEAVHNMKSLGFVRVEGDALVLTEMGRLMARTLFIPEKVVTTLRNSLKRNGPINYCGRNGLWAAITLNVSSDIRYLFFPLKTNEVAAHARENLMPGFNGEPSEEFSMELNLTEVGVFQLSQYLISQRVEEKGSSLKEGESWFYARELFAPQFLEGLTATSFLGMEEGLPEKMVANLSDLVTTTCVFQSLVEKGVFEAWKKIGEPTRFQHSAAAKDWMTADGLLDRVLIHEENDGKLSNYHLREKGILEVSQKDQSLSYRKLDDIPMEDFF